VKYWLLPLCFFITTHAVWAEFSDPMRPPAFALEKFRLEKIKNKVELNRKPVKSQKKDPWVLNSILYSSQRKHAIINNQLVRKGEFVKGAKLVRLQPDSVRLIKKGKIIDLTIYGLSGKGNFKLIKKSLNEKKI